MKGDITYYSNHNTYLFYSRYMCPTNYNPSDYIMHLSQTETQESLLAKGIFDLSFTNKISDSSELSQVHSFPPLLHFLLPSPPPPTHLTLPVPLPPFLLL